jgi:hypothetical protein
MQGNSFRHLGWHEGSGIRRSVPTNEISLPSIYPVKPKGPFHGVARLSPALIGRGQPLFPAEWANSCQKWEFIETNVVIFCILQGAPRAHCAAKSPEFLCYIHLSPFA